MAERTRALEILSGLSVFVLSVFTAGKEYPLKTFLTAYKSPFHSRSTAPADQARVWRDGEAERQTKTHREQREKSHAN